MFIKSVIIVHILYLGFVQKYKFMVLPSVFVVTAQHKESKEKEEWTLEQHRRWLRGLTKIIIPEVKDRREPKEMWLWPPLD